MPTRLLLSHPRTVRVAAVGASALALVVGLSPAGAWARGVDRSELPGITRLDPNIAGQPSLPLFSGVGRRVVYDMGLMQVWLVEADGTVVRSYPVSGHKSRTQPGVGEFWVYSRSEHASHRDNPNVRWEHMVRFAWGTNEGLAIGFHAIPTKNGRPMQGVEDLGQALSSGCVRQAPEDADAMWEFAQLGTKVVVIDSSGRVPEAARGAYPRGERPNCPFGCGAPSYLPQGSPGLRLG